MTPEQIKQLAKEYIAANKNADSVEIVGLVQWVYEKNNIPVEFSEILDFIEGHN